MKKIISLVLIAVLVLSLSSCGASKAIAAYKLYSKATKTIEKAGGYEADCTMAMSMNVLGQDLEMAYDMNVKQNGDNISISRDDGGIAIETVLIDNVVYMNVAGQKIKYTVNTEELTDELADSMGTANLPELAKEFFENVDVIKNEDGTKTITLALDNETAKEITGLVNSQSDEMGGNVSFDNIFLTMRFTKKDKLDSMTLDCDMTVSTEIVDVTAHMAVGYQFINFGKAPKVVAPEDADTYTDGGEYTQELN